MDVYVGEGLDSLTVTSGGSTLPVTVNGTHYSYSVSGITLDGYRMTGSHHLPTVTGDTYLSPGAPIVSFTPNRINGADTIVVQLPYSNTERTVTNMTHMDVEQDIQVYSVTDDVYLGFDSVGHNSAGYILVRTDTSLVQGQEYVVKMSGNSSGYEQRMPGDGTYTAYVSIGKYRGTGSIFNYEKQNSVYFHNLTIGNTGSENPGNEAPVDGNPAGSAQPPVDHKQTVNEASLKNAEGGKVTVAIADGKKQVLLPARATKALGGNSLMLDGDELTVEIPSEVLAELEGLLAEEDLGDAEISFDFNQVTEEVSQELINKAQEGASAELKKAGLVYDFDLAITGKDGKKHKLDSFSKKIKLKLSYSEDANQDLVGVYYISQDGEIEYAGGTVEDGALVAEVSHFSTYAVLEYAKEFTDVDASHWAADVIKSMAAKHVINGTSDAEFQPEDNMTRAEFAAVMIRALGLRAEGTASFEDVAAEAWYYGVVAAAAEAGLINGKSATKFAPEDNITREEMVTILVRAYLLKSGETDEMQTQAPFQDRNEASAWAQSSIDAAVAYELISGRDDNLFAPKDLMTRAEGAQVAYTLFNK